MDIYIKSDIEDVKEILSESGFTLKKGSNNYSAIKHKKGGRYHILFTFIDGETFCDLHFDHTIHLLGIGVDYGKKPKNFFNSELKRKLDRKKIRYKIRKVNWFTRRNKAVVTGFRL